MTAVSTSAEQSLADLGVHLLKAPTRFCAHVYAVQTGSILFFSGMLATVCHNQ